MTRRSRPVRANPRGAGRLDVLVANAWADYLPYPEHNEWFSQPFWEQSMARWDGMFTAGAIPLATCLFGLPCCARRATRWAVLTTFTRGPATWATSSTNVGQERRSRLVAALPRRPRDTDLAVLGVSPGWMAVERMTGLSERKQARWSRSLHRPAVAELACDPAVSRRSGQTLAVGDLARSYGFTGRHGRQPTPYVIEP